MIFKEPLEQNKQLELLKQYKLTNDPDIKEILIIHNLKLVNWVARKYNKPGKNELDDLFQSGIIGLMRAIEGYNPNLGAFSTYAVDWIRQAITRDISNYEKIIRIPDHMLQQVNKLIRIKNKLFQDLEREPTEEDLSIEMGVDIETIKEILTIVQDPISINTIISGEDEDLTLESSIIDENSLFEDALIGNLFIEQVIKEFKPKLTEEELNIIILSYCIDGKEYTLKEIGERYKLSVEQVRQKKSNALRDMRRSHFMQQLRRDLDEETTFYRSIDYSQPRVTGGIRSSPVENIVLERERIAKRLENMVISNKGGQAK